MFKLQSLILQLHIYIVQMLASCMNFVCVCVCVCVCKIVGVCTYVKRDWTRLCVCVCFLNTKCGVM